MRAPSNERIFYKVSINDVTQIGEGKGDSDLVTHVQRAIGAWERRVNFESYLCDVIYGRSLISEILDIQVEKLRISVQWGIPLPEQSRIQIVETSLLAEWTVFRCHLIIGQIVKQSNSVTKHVIETVWIPKRKHPKCPVFICNLRVSDRYTLVDS